MTAHNFASEFAAVVRASSPRKHAEKLVGRYNTPIAWAFALLGLPRKYNKLEPFKSWRRGLYKPPAWVRDMLADALEERANYYREIAAALEIGPGAGKAGAEALRRYREKKKAALSDGLSQQE